MGMCLIGMAVNGVRLGDGLGRDNVNDGEIFDQISLLGLL